MSQHRTNSGRKHRIGGGLLLGAVASGALAVGALGSAGEAYATCASVSGVNNGNGCVTTVGPNIAVGIGDNTKATAAGFGNLAVSMGKNATTIAEGTGNVAIAVGAPGPGIQGPNTPTQSYAIGTFNRSVSLGDGTASLTNGLNNNALAVGNGSVAASVGSQVGFFGTPGSNNTAITIGNNSDARAVGNNKFGAALGNGKAALNGVNNLP